MTVDDLPLFKEAELARDAGIALVREGRGSAGWIAYALDFLEAYCKANAFVFCDDVWAAGLEPPPNGSLRTLGAVFQSAARKGWILPTYTLRKSVRSRLGPKPVWRSGLYTPRAA